MMCGVHRRHFGSTISPSRAVMGLIHTIQPRQNPAARAHRRIDRPPQPKFAAAPAKSPHIPADIHSMATPPHHSISGEQTRLVSEFAGDTDMSELIEYFLAELKDRIGGLEHAMMLGDHERLRQLAHQLKGAAGGYGYPSITNSAADLEFSLAAEQAELSCVSEKVEALIALCKRATGGS